jgi:CHAT domain-containing protein/tetratricopeptide (TPR) repeat protein
VEGLVLDPTERLLLPPPATEEALVQVEGLPPVPAESVADAIPIYEGLIRILASTLGSEHPKVARGYHFLAGLHQVLGEADRAEELHLQALAILAAREPDGLDTAGMANNIGLFYMREGKLAHAIELFERSLDLLGELDADKRAYAAHARQNLAAAYHRLGDLGHAEESYSAALDLYRGAPQRDPAKEGILLQNLATVSLSLGYLERARDQFRSLLESPSLPREVKAAAFNGLGETHRRRGEATEAAAAYHQASDLLGPEHGGRVLVLSNLGFLHYQAGDLAAARTHLELALALAERLHGPDSSEVALLLVNLASVDLAEGQPSRARDRLHRARGRLEKDLPSHHPAITGVLENLAFASYALGERGRAWELALAARRLKEEHWREVLSYSTEAQRLSLLASSAPYDLLAGLVSEPGQLEELAAAVLRSKGLVLSSLLQERALGHRSGQGATRRQLLDLHALRQRWFEASLRSARANEGEGRGEVQELEREMARLERFLGAGDATKGAWRDLQGIAPAQVRAALGSDELLLEIIRYRRPAGGSRLKDRYGVLLLGASGPPRWVDLGPTEGIDRSVEALLQQVRCNGRSPHVLGPSCGDDEPIEKSLRSLYSFLWAPVAGHLAEGVRRVVISPDGDLNLVPWAALLDEQERFLVDRYDLSYVSSGRDLSARTDLPPVRRLVTLADPLFGAPDATEGSLPFTLESLPYSGTEARRIQEIARAHGWQAVGYQGAAADERALRELGAGGGPPGILHVATHAWVLGAGDPGPGRLAGLLRHPMDRTFLALSGAQSTLRSWARGTGSATRDDGIVTAGEIAGLDLSGTWLTILSACDTARGESQVGEGVIGLRRGFALAGATHLVTTLWPVSDQGTAEFMIELYPELLETLDPVAALGTTQRRRMRELRDSSGLATAVHRAGGFVLSQGGGWPGPQPAENQAGASR